MILNKTDTISIINIKKNLKCPFLIWTLNIVYWKFSLGLLMETHWNKKLCTRMYNLSQIRFLLSGLKKVQMNFKFTFFHFLKDTVVWFTLMDISVLVVLWRLWTSNNLSHPKKTTNIGDHYGTGGKSTKQDHLVKGVFINIINNQDWFF